MQVNYIIMHYPVDLLIDFTMKTIIALGLLVALFQTGNKHL